MDSFYKIRFDLLMTTFWVYLWSLCFALCGSYLIILITFGAEILADWGVLVESTVWMQIVLLAASPLGALLICSFSETDIGLQAISGRTFWGAKRIVYWPDITVIRCQKILGVQFIKIMTEPATPALWLGLASDQKNQLINYLRRTHQQDNKLLVVLRDGP